MHSSCKLSHQLVDTIWTFTVTTTQIHCHHQSVSHLEELQLQWQLDLFLSKSILKVGMDIPPFMVTITIITIKILTQVDNSNKGRSPFRIHSPRQLSEMSGLEWTFSLERCPWQVNNNAQMTIRFVLIKMKNVRKYWMYISNVWCCLECDECDNETRW